MDQKDILAYVDNYPGQKVKLAITDIDGILRGKIIHKKKFMSILEGGFGFCDVVFGWDAADVAYDNGQITGWHTGYPDAQARLDISTFRKVPWENDLPFFLADFVNDEGIALASCPRNLLKKIKDQALEMGYAPVFSQEFEWFNFEETPQSLEDKNFIKPKPMTPGMFGYSVLRSSLKNEFFHDLFDLLGQFDVPIEGLHTETGPGVYEAAILYDDILTAADRAVLFKTGTKEIAYKHGIIASFMAKWREDLPGCSGHVHQSLWDRDRINNLFHSDDDDLAMSDLMKSYVAGQLYCLPHVLPMYAPTINSYKRLVEGAWAPTTLTWGKDNRTTALRVLTGGAKSARLETRVCGSDSNPYLAMSAALASGLYGIRHGLTLDQPRVIGNGYEDFSNGVLPRNLHQATQAMKNSEVSKELFGEAFVDHYVRTRDWEWREFSKAITDWEMRRYFEII
ncbi:MAG: glutamine synthetase [Bacteroidetes bacterium]|nr:glutamine synthetase [Bacteroidota bacterium]